MTFQTLVRLVAEHWPNEALTTMAETDGDPVGDRLAMAVYSQLEDYFDETASDEAQMKMAGAAIRLLQSDLHDLIDGLQSRGQAK